MKKLFGLAFLLSGLLFVTSCGDDEPDPVGATCTDGIMNGDETGVDCGGSCTACESDVETVQVTANITENTTWTSDKIYVLNGRIIVEGGATLTIEAGTVIKGEEGQEANASVLMTAIGGTLIANGTASAPIIFTSVLDDIMPGETESSLDREDDKGLWGGVVLLGDAPISADNAQEQIEGVPSEETLGLYGGDDADDNSGSLQYVSIRFGGTVIEEGSEINGLTLGGVGSGTTINHIEIYGNVDDGVEFFGGTVNASNLLINWQGDDAIDIDQGYSGTVNNFLVTHGGSDTDEGLEIDGIEGDPLSSDDFTLMNGTLISDGGDNASAADFKSKAEGSVENVLWQSYNGGATIKFRASYQNDCSESKSDAYSNLIGSTLTFTDAQFDAVSVYTDSQNDDETADCEVSAAEQTSAEENAVAGTATGADTSVFGWTLSASRSQI